MKKESFYPPDYRSWSFLWLTFGLALFQYFHTMPLFLPFVMVMCILDHCVLEAFHLPFDFTVVTINICFESQKRFEY